MTRVLPRRTPGEGGFALVYMAILITFLLVATGLAVDGGRAYVVKAQLTKAVDGAALSAARNLNSGNPRVEAEKIFRANFPDGYMGVSSVTNPTTDTSFFESATLTIETGVNVVTVRATAVVADDVHAPGQFQRGHRDEHGRSATPDGRPLARARRLRLDRFAVAGGP